MMPAMTSASHGPGVEDEGIPSFLFNFDQFEKLEEIGRFDDREGRVELIEGTLIQMAPPGADHSDVILDLAFRLRESLGAPRPGELRVGSQSTLRIGNHSAPEPDVFVARRAKGQKYYLAEDTVLVVKVAVTTFKADQSLKRPMYARAGIPELWIIEPLSRSIHVHREPQAGGTWGEAYTVTEGAISPLFAPRIAITLDDVFRSL